MRQKYGVYMMNELNVDVRPNYSLTSKSPHYKFFERTKFKIFAYNFGHRKILLSENLNHKHTLFSWHGTEMIFWLNQYVK